MPPLPLDANRVEQALIHLLRNAIQATPAGAAVTVTLSRRHLAGLGQNVGASWMDRFRVGDHLACVHIQDEGPGMTQAQLAQAFDPFYTTRPTGVGTGLGLTVTKAIIEMHGGIVDLRNRASGGLEATVLFRI